MEVTWSSTFRVGRVFNRVGHWDSPKYAGVNLVAILDSNLLINGRFIEHGN